MSTRQLELVYTPANAGAVPIVADAAPVDIRPLQRWMGLLTARRGPAGDKVNGRLQPAKGWRAISDQAGLVTTVLVHGYGVDDDDAIGSYSTVVRNLYWSGLPVLDETRRQLVGILWPGNVGVTGKTYFPGDEFTAFQTGVPLGRFFKERKVAGQALHILAHSLGNLAVNSAILRAPSMSVASDRYIMVEAAVAVEAFSHGYRPDSDPGFPGNPALPFQRMVAPVGGAIDAGYPRDRRWSEQWNRNDPVCEDDPDTVDDPLDPGRDDICLAVRAWWSRKIALMIPRVHVAPDFTVRWTKYTDQAPWRGIFVSNLARAQFWNFFNRDDQALEIAKGDGLQASPWLLAQLLMKPYVEPWGLHPDVSGLSWALLDQSLAPGDFDALWRDSPESETERANTLRLWSELAFQLQPLSGPTGAQPAEALGVEHNPDMTRVGGAGGFPDYPSHTYWTSPLGTVGPFYKQVADLMKQP